MVEVQPQCIMGALFGIEGVHFNKQVMWDVSSFEIPYKSSHFQV